MQTYFIHTIEIYRLISHEEFTSLNKGLRRFNNGNEHRCLEHEKDGITVLFSKCTDNEKKKKGNKYPFKLIVIFNPSRLIENNTYINRIWNTNAFVSSITIFNEKLKFIFENIIPEISGINDFVLSRIDITKYSSGIPENMIQEYIKTIRRFPLNYGYALNTQLEENCPTFKHENSVNILNKSKGIEFVLYNKHQATIDQKYPDEIKNYYANTLRMELRCSRKFIKKKSNELKDFDVFHSLIYFYINKESIVKDTFYRIFTCGYDSCFLSHYWLKKEIKKKFDSKEKRKSKMLKLVNCLYRNPDKTLDEALDYLFPSKKTQATIMKAFRKIQLSPIAIQSHDIPYMQSIESLLKFENSSKNEIKYFDIVRVNSRGKKVFLHD